MRHSRTFPRLLVAVGAVLTASLLLSACSTDSTSDPSESSSSETSSPQTGTELQVTINNEARVDEWTLTCDPQGGTHPDPRQACSFLELSKQWGKDPFTPVPDDAVCAQLFGGPQTATVTGVWDGKPVDAKFNLSNSCEIARWSNAVPLLVVEGTAPNAEQPR